MGKTGPFVAPVYMKDANGAEREVIDIEAYLKQRGVKILPTDTGGLVIVEERSFTETTGAGTYTATVAIPAGASVLDVIWDNTVLWTAATSATLNVGDGDDSDGYITGVDVKAAPAADVNGAGGISSKGEDTGTGAYKGLVKKYSTGGTITATVVTIGASGNAGRSKLFVIYALPASVIAAIKA